MPPPEVGMRWSIIRLIWLRELRDQLRDRRTIFMVAVLPVLIYPLVALGVLRFAGSAGKSPTVVGVYGCEHLPAAGPTSADANPAPAVAWLSAAPPLAPGTGTGLSRLAGAAALAGTANQILGTDEPPLLRRDEKDWGSFLPAYLDPEEEAPPLKLQLLSWPDGVPPAPPAGEDIGPWLRPFERGPLEQRKVALVLIVPGDFDAQLARGGRPDVYLLSRPRDERSRQAGNRVHAILGRWNRRLAQVRLLRRGLPADYDEAFAVRDPERAQPPAKQAADLLSEALVRIFPFLLVTWALTGALYPAVDLCAGEKERGTMETLLISPASREEIVYGKFLTIWVFSGSTALLNLASMGVTTAVLSGQLPLELLRPAALAWAVLLVLPLSAFFSAVCLAVGAYARSTKEGQYYLMPLFLITMPLIFLTVVPGVELNAFYAMVPITGVALLLQRLLTPGSLHQVWPYFVPVLAPLLLYGWLALRWAVSQFQREEVLFREAERLDLGLWLRRLFREKQPLPTPGEAVFCFGLILGLRWLSLGVGARWPLLLHAAVDLLAFVVTPPLLMAVLLTTRPRYGLGLRLPPPRALLSAAVLVLLLALPLADLSRHLLGQFPDIKKLMTETTPMAELMQAVQRGQGGARGPAWLLPLVLVLLAPVCEELAFRGFILTGLRQRFHPWTAILLSSLLFAVSHLNVFQFLPTLILGVVLGLVATRSRSVLPGILLHLLYNGLFVAPVVFPGFADALARTLASPPYLRPVLVAVCTLLVTVYLAVNGYRLWLMGRSPWWDEIAPPKPRPGAAEGANGAVAADRSPDSGAVT
jgi:sodium transport system permease protein